MIYKNEEGYLQLLKDVYETGVDVTDRTGVGRRVKLNAALEFDNHCLSTVRPLPLKSAFLELMFWLNGKTQTKELEEQGVKFWAGNTSREFLDSRGLSYLNEGELGSAYSLAWRNSGGYKEAASRGVGESLAVGGVDQLQLLVDELRENKYSSRNVVNLYNPSEVNLGALPPCWFGSVWNVIPNSDGVDELHVHLLNRSCDLLLGSFMALGQYKMLQIALCKMLGYAEGKLSATLVNAHIYLNQLDFVEETLQRKLGKQGAVVLNKDISTLEELLSLSWEDWSVDGLEVNRTPYTTPRPAMVA